MPASWCPTTFSAFERDDHGCRRRPRSSAGDDAASDAPSTRSALRSSARNGRRSGCGIGIGTASGAARRFLQRYAAVRNPLFIVQVIHDGDDLKAARILAGIRKVAATDAKLLLIECIVPENSKPSWDQDARSADADATVATTRTNASRTLRIRRAAGFRLDRAIDVGLWTSMLKSVAV